MAISFNIETITPEVASRLLESNTRNRSVRRLQVDKYTADMALGRWFDATAEPIKVAADGTLLDGQHRLMACVKSNTPFVATVARGLPAEAMEFLDSGEARDAGDVLSINGHRNSHQLSAAASTLLDMKNGAVRKGGRPRTEILAAVARHPRLTAAVSRCSGVRCGIPPSLLSAILYAGSELMHRREDSERFIAVLHTGIPSEMGEQDPAFVWRERIVRSRLSSGSHMTLTRDAVYRGTVQAFNFFLRRQAVRKFMIPDKPTGIDGLRTDAI